MIVDGYNVTKLGYASLTLEDQRSRLLSGLGALYPIWRVTRMRAVVALALT